MKPAIIKRRTSFEIGRDRIVWPIVAVFLGSASFTGGIILLIARAFQ